MKRALLSILLITAIIIIASVAFFNYSVKMSSPTAMELKVPKEENIDYEKVLSKLTVVLLKNDMIYGYYSNNIHDGKLFAFKEIGNLIRDGIEKYTRDSLVVVIKKDKEATYQNTVDMLDEMSKNGIKRYSLVELSEGEFEFAKKVE
jgi:biopolymer transport protein ExbD